jgi:hypothetical protein
MTKTLGFGGAALALVIGCGDGSSGEGGGGAGGSSEETTSSVTTKATTGAGTTSSTTSSVSASSISSTTAVTTGAGGGGAEHCTNAVRCDGVQGYFCYEVSGPNAAFEQACADELFGTFEQGPCGPEYDTSACLFDCEEPSIFSVAITIDQAECEGDGGTWIENP